MRLQYKTLTERALKDFSGFSCGNEPWNDLADFLLNDAFEQQENRHNRTYLFYADDKPAAYVTVSADSIKRERIPAPYGNISTVLIGRLAVDTRFKGKGIAQEIMAWVRYQAATLWLGCRFVAVHVDIENTRALQFYEQQGFFVQPYSRTRQKLMLYDLVATND